MSNRSLKQNILNTFIILGKVLTLIGALGLFLYGMKLMSEALQRVAGQKMRNILSAMTSNRLKGVLTGFLVTTTIQSSSATTVMIVSFVNAGLLSLIGAIGVIMGANIGTTVTAWLVTILGFKVKMHLLALPLIGIGFPMFFSNKTKTKNLGEFIIGFAILFIGLEFLKSSVPSFESNQSFLEFVARFTDFGIFSTLLFVLIGTILTVVIQSSSATMALTLVMVYNGLIEIDIAAAMILGENIGTTITANLAAIVGNRSAKRAARAHFIFNIIGVLWVLIIFRPFLRGIDIVILKIKGVSAFTHIPDDFENIKQVLLYSLSAFHTAFNILNTALLIWFAPLIEKIVIKMVPDKDDDEDDFQLKHITSSILSTAEIDIIQVKKELKLFSKRLNKMFDLLPLLLDKKNEKKIPKYYQKIKNWENKFDNLQTELSRYLAEVSQNVMSETTSIKIKSLFRIINELESMGDSCYKISTKIEQTFGSKVKFKKQTREKLLTMFSVVKEALVLINEIIEKDYPIEKFEVAVEIENRINEKRDQYIQELYLNIKNEEMDFETGLLFKDIIAAAEKIGDYALNIHEELAQKKKRTVLK